LTSRPEFFLISSFWIFINSKWDQYSYQIWAMTQLQLILKQCYCSHWHHATFFFNLVTFEFIAEVKYWELANKN
jgi:hypothetical protein